MKKKLVLKAEVKEFLFDILACISMLGLIEVLILLNLLMF